MHFFFLLGHTNFNLDCFFAAATSAVVITVAAVAVATAFAIAVAIAIAVAVVDAAVAVALCCYWLLRRVINARFKLVVLL